MIQFLQLVPTYARKSRRCFSVMLKRENCRLLSFFSFFPFLSFPLMSKKLSAMFGLSNTMQRLNGWMLRKLFEILSTHDSTSTLYNGKWDKNFDFISKIRLNIAWRSNWQSQSVQFWRISPFIRSARGSWNVINRKVTATCAIYGSHKRSF